MLDMHNELFDFSIFPVLITERLTLRQPNRTDAADFLVFRGDPYVQRYNGPVITTLGEVQAQIEEALVEYNDQEGITWAVTVRDSDTAIGHFGLHRLSRYHRRAEAGYDLARAYWGHGMATEALRAILKFGFMQMNLHRIYANTIADNYESVRLLERLGFQREGTQREFSWEDDHTFHDSAIYGLLRREFTG